MKKWEYLVLDREDLRDEDYVQQMGGYGEEGWELVAVTDHYLFFKRPKE